MLCVTRRASILNTCLTNSVSSFWEALPYVEELHETKLVEENPEVVVIYLLLMFLCILCVSIFLYGQ